MFFGHFVIGLSVLVASCPAWGISKYPPAIFVMLPMPLSTAAESPSTNTAVPFPLRWSPSFMYLSAFPTKLPHKSTKPTSSSLHSFSTSMLIAIPRQFRYLWPLLPITGRIPDSITGSNSVCFSVLTNFLYFLTMAVVPSLSTLFVPTCTKTDPPLPEPMMFSLPSQLSPLFWPQVSKLQHHLPCLRLCRSS